MKMAGCSPPPGDWLIMAVTLAAIQLSHGKTVDELALMSSFFSLLSSSLGFLAVTRFEDDDLPLNNDCKADEKKIH
jgi:hypothetical protein